MPNHHQVTFGAVDQLLSKAQDLLGRVTVVGASESHPKDYALASDAFDAIEALRRRLYTHNRLWRDTGRKPAGKCARRAVGDVRPRTFGCLGDSGGDNGDSDLWRAHTSWDPYGSDPAPERRVVLGDDAARVLVQLAHLTQRLLDGTATGSERVLAADVLDEIRARSWGSRESATGCAPGR